MVVSLEAFKYTSGGDGDGQDVQVTSTTPALFHGDYRCMCRCKHRWSELPHKINNARSRHGNQ